MDIALFPGFALKPSMYSRLKFEETTCGIDLIPENTWADTINRLSLGVPSKALGIGYSLGGRIALSMAIARPHLFSGLVLISVHAGLDDIERASRRQEDQELADQFLNDHNKAFHSFDERDIFEPLESSTSSFLQDNRINNKELIAGQLRVLGLGSMPYLENQLMTLPIPVLYITGSRDPKYIKLARRYKEQTLYSYHFSLDSDHRVPLWSPQILSLYIQWFTENIF